jgi:microcystin-dependent protein
MPLETAAYIPDLVVTNPAASDPLSNADDHLRLIKLVLKNTFPNFTDAALNSTQANLDIAATQAARTGWVPPGAIVDFGMPTPPTGWLACDGQAVSRTTYPDLFAAISTTWGAGDGSTTFNVPGLTSRFRRHRDGSTLSGAVGNLQNPQNLTHTHTGSGSTAGADVPDHLHVLGGQTGSMNRSNPHSHSSNAINGAFATGSGPDGPFSIPQGAIATINATDINHEHSLPATTGGRDRSLVHAHAFSFTTSNGSADGAEARPYSATVLSCIKT